MTEKEPKLIYSPFVKVNDPEEGEEVEPGSPLVLVYSEGRTYIGGFLGFNDIGLVNLDSPMSYIEVNQGGRFSAGLQPVFVVLGPMGKLSVKPGMVYFLNADKKSNKSLADSYVDSIEAMAADELGIVKPSGQDIANVTRLTPK